MVDITKHLKKLNKMLQERNKVVMQYYNSLCVFKLNLSLWDRQLAGGDAAHFPCLKAVCVTQRAAKMKQFKDKVTGQLRKLEQGFQIFGKLERLQSFLLSIRHECLRSVRQHPT